MADENADAAVVHISPELRESLLRGKRPAMIVPTPQTLEDPLERLERLFDEDLTHVKGQLGRIEELLIRMDGRMDKVEQIADLVKEQVKPVLDEITNGPIGKIMGISPKRR